LLTQWTGIIFSEHRLTLKIKHLGQYRLFFGQID